MKSQLIRGDTLNFLTQVPAYLASAGWTLGYRLVPRVSGSAITFNASAEGDNYRVNVVASTTAGWAIGDYSWAAYVTKGAERYTVDQGTAQILADPGAVAAPYDLRSHARKMVEAIETALEAFGASPVMKSYTIGSRQYLRADIPDLLVLRDRYRNEVASEEAAEKVAAGLGNPRNIGMRFNRV